MTKKTTLTISLPHEMKLFIESKLREGRFSTPSEYIRALIRDDQDCHENREIATLIRRWIGMANSKPSPNWAGE